MNSPRSIADELAKLAGLLKGGTLGAEEIEHQKALLLRVNVTEQRRPATFGRAMKSPALGSVISNGLKAGFFAAYWPQCLIIFFACILAITIVSLYEPRQPAAAPTAPLSMGDPDYANKFMMGKWVATGGTCDDTSYMEFQKSSIVHVNSGKRTSVDIGGYRLVGTRIMIVLHHGDEPLLFGYFVMNIDSNHIILDQAGTYPELTDAMWHDLSKETDGKIGKWMLDNMNRDFPKNINLVRCSA